MTKQEKLKNYVNKFLHLITSNEDPLKNYTDLNTKKNNLIDLLDIDISDVKTSEIVKELNSSPYKHLYNKKSIDINEFANQIFLNKLSNVAEKSGFKKMMKGITKSNYLGNIYTRFDDNSYYKETYGIELNNVEKYINGDILHKLGEFRGNFATFIEHYYNTKEGFDLVEFYKDKPDDVMQNEFIGKLFKKMNESSLVESLIKKNDGTYDYVAGTAGSLDGIFILFDEKYNMLFNVSSTISKDVSKESDSILRHAVTSKFIADAIVAEIDKEIDANDLIDKYTEDKSILKKVRAKVWETYASNPKDLDINQRKNIFLHNAIAAHITKHGLAIKIDTNEDNIKLGLTVKNMVKELNSSDTQPATIMNAVLKSKGDITEKKMKEFFENKDDNQFNTHFVSEVVDLQATLKFADSSLDQAMKKLKINMVDLKSFLQVSTLKNYTLDENIKSFSKKALEFFYNNILTRRIFGEINQKKINLPWFKHNAEKIIFENFILKPNSQITENLKHLNLDDKKNITSFFKFMLFNKAEDNYIEKKLEELGIKSNNYKDLAIKVVDKIHQNYDDLFQKTTDLKKINEVTTRADTAETRANTAEEALAKFQKEQAEKIEKVKKEAKEEARKELLEEQQREKERNKEAVARLNEDLEKPENARKQGVVKLNKDDDLDRSKQVIDLENIEKEKNSVKSDHKNVTAPTIKKKLN